jgi:hypothetical protein
MNQFTARCVEVIAEQIGAVVEKTFRWKGFTITVAQHGYSSPRWLAGFALPCYRVEISHENGLYNTHCWGSLADKEKGIHNRFVEMAAMACQELIESYIDPEDYRTNVGMDEDVQSSIDRTIRAAKGFGDALLPLSTWLLDKDLV